MKDFQRPVFLDLRKIRLPVTAIVSILHRLSGLCLALSLPFIVFAVFLALSSPERYSAMVRCFYACWITRVGVLMVALAYLYHALAGFRHLIMDLGFGLSRKAGVASAQWMLGSFGIIALFLVKGVLWA
jgi:succinate dehydrogenase / fumarate reductase cytochrome b subunit